MEHDPVRLLGAVGRERWSELAEDDGFVQRLNAAKADLDGYLSADRWYQRKAGADAPRAIGYFSPEFGITAVLPQYSGGLGILAGDHLKAASDLGVPLVGVGLLYKHGYFKQSLSREGWQQETYPVLDPDELPLSLLREDDGTRATVSIEMPGGPDLVARIWVASVGRVPLLLLDSDVEGNPDHYREVTDRLYGGTKEHRLQPGAAARRGRRTSPARVLPHHRRTRARGLPHQRGPRRLPRPRADPRADRRRGRSEARLGHRGRGLPRVHRLHHAHAGARRHRPLPARARRAVLRRQRPDGRHPRRQGARPRHRGLRGRRRHRLQHGRDGLPSRPARQRRLGAARPRQPRHVQRPVAGVRRGRGTDRLDHERRARADLGRARGHRAGRLARRRPRRRRRRLLLPRGRPGARHRDLGGQARAARAARPRRAPSADQVQPRPRHRQGRARLGRLAARPRRADDRLRAPGAVVQAAHPHAARPGPPQEAAAAPRAPRSS